MTAPSIATRPRGAAREDPLLAAFDRLCRDRGDRPALWSRGEGLRLTFGQISERVAAWRRLLRRLPPVPVALATGNCAAFPELFLALRSDDRPAVLVDGALPAAEKRALCRALGVPLLLHRDLDGADPALAEEIRLATLAGVEPAVVPAGTALVKLTSGSTGTPRGLCLSSRALAAGIDQIARGMAIVAADRVLITIPLSHSYGFDNGVLSLLAVGTPLVLEPSFYPRPLLAALAEGEVTFFPAVPPMIRALAECSWPAALPLARVISAGGPLDAAFAERFHHASGRAVHQFYGSTETGGISFERRPDAPEAAGTVGEPLPGVRVELDPCGRVAVDSAACYHGVLGEGPRTAGPVVLGDRGEWTADGRLRLTGRTSDLLKVAGRRVSVAAIEAALRRLPGVADAAVVGVADAVRGDCVVAFVVGEAQRLDADDLPAGLAPRQVRRLDALPYTERGKVDREQLRRLATRRPR